MNRDNACFLQINDNMLTLRAHRDNVELCKMRDGKKLVPVFWHPVRDKTLRLAVSDINGFATEEFRDRFRISKSQADEILEHLKAGTTPEGGIQRTFFKAKHFIESSLYNEMDLSDSTQELELGFPPGAETWGELSLVCGASSSGKTYHCVDKIIKNLDGPKKDRRFFVIISNEFDRDKTLGLLKKEKYRRRVHGIDISEASLANSEHESAQAFFDEEVKPHIEHASRGSVLVIDDAMDSCCAPMLRKTINTLLRTARHDDVGLMFILHSIRSGLWSTQASSSCKYFVLFPRSQRGKVRDFLNKELGCTLPEARTHVRFRTSRPGDDCPTFFAPVSDR